MKRAINTRAMVVLGFLLLGPSTQGDVPTDASDSIEVELGFAGYYRLGRWTPVTIRFSGIEDCRGVYLIAPDDEGVPTRFLFDGEPVESEEGRTVVNGCIRLGRVPTVLQVGAKQGRGGAVEPMPLHSIRDLPEPVFNAQQFAVVLGNRLDLKGAVRLQQRLVQEAVVTASVSPEQLPTQWFAWEGIDLLVVPTGELEVIRQVNAEQWDAIATWVQMGGRLILSVGEHGDTLLSSDHPLAALAPGRFGQVLRQRETAGLENFASLSRRAAAKRIDITDEVGRFTGVPSVKFESLEGVVACSDGRGQTKIDWVVHRAHGLGVITFVATDLDIGPISVWEGRTRMLMKLLQDTLPGRNDDVTDFDSRSVKHFGFTDISGHLRSALEQFPDVRLVPFGLIGAIAFGFALLIGPVDFLLLGRSPGRSRWTWLTFSLTVLAFTVGIAALAQFWKGQQLLANQVTLIDYDTVNGILRGTNWTHVYAPRTLEIDGHCSSTATAGGEAILSDQLFSWHGLAGSGFGGMNSRAAIGDSLPPYSIQWQQQNPGWTTGVERLLMPSWSSRRFLAMWRAEKTGTSEPPLVVAPRSGLVSGAVTNPLQLTLKSAYLCFDRWLFEIGDLKPGESYVIDQSATPFDLHSRLTRRQILDAKQIASPWDEGNLEVPRIMEMIMFHDAAGGRSYTSLLHRQAATLDFSDQLKLHRAVLVGRVSRLDNAVEIVAGTEEPQYRTWNICRILIPVDSKQTSD